MNSTTKKKLEAAGWKVGSVDEFLQLTPEESRLLNLKVAFANGIRELRTNQGLSQAALADRLGSSQSRIAKIEAGSRSVSIDLMLRSLLALGATTKQIAKWIERAEPKRAA